VHSRNACDGSFEHLEVHRLGEVRGKSGIIAQADILFHAIATQRNAFQAARLTQYSHELMACPVRQAEVADEQVKTLALREGKELRKNNLTTPC
jgi:hypothetical protein